MADMRLSAPASGCEPNLYMFEGQNVRVLERAGDPWFVARDVAELLGYQHPADTIRAHCKGVDEISTPSPGGSQLTKIIPERDVYRLIMRSKLPAAERFEEWVVGEVLPQIRKTGAYAAPAAEEASMPMTEVVQRLLSITEKLVDFMPRRIPALTNCCLILVYLRGGKAQMRDISASVGRPHRYAEQLVQKMRKFGLVLGWRGPEGGYELTFEGRSADVYDVARLMFDEVDSPLVKAWKGLDPSEITDKPVMSDEWGAVA